MTEVTGVSDILNPPAPVTPEAAAQRIVEMDASPEFRQRVKDGDAAAFQERGELWRVAHGMPAKPQPAVNEIDVLTEMSGRVLAENQARAERLRADGISELGIYEFMNGRPVPLEQHQMAERQLARLKIDKGFQQRLRDGDAAARHEWTRVHLELTMPTVSNSVDGKTPAPEIVAWERAHAGRKPAA